MKWFRFYNEVLHDSKVQTLPAELYRTWTNLLCVASENDPRGQLPSLRQVSFLLRMKEDRVKVAVEQLVSLGLLDRDEVGTLSPHNWEQRQPESDDVASRVRESRRRKKAAATEPVTLHDTEHVRRCNGEIRLEEIRLEEKPPLPPVSGGAGEAGGNGDISTIEELLIQVASEFRRPDWTAEVRANSESIEAKVGERLDCFLAGLRQAARSRTKIHDLIGFAIDRARVYQRDGIPREPLSVEPKTARPADRGAPPPPPGRAESVDCEHCSGEGQVTVYHPDPASTRQPATTSADCTCLRGRAIRQARKPDDARRIPDLADVLAGRGPWRSEPPQETSA